MPTTVREQIETVLRKHLENSSIEVPRIHSVYKQLSACVDDLLVCWPRPGREEGLKILNAAFTEFKTYKMISSEVVMDSLMRWATGTRERRWCEHIKWCDPKDIPPLVCGPEARWALIGATAISVDSWIQCPHCAAPRPTETP